LWWAFNDFYVFVSAFYEGSCGNASFMVGGSLNGIALGRWVPRRLHVIRHNDTNDSEPTILKCFRMTSDPSHIFPAPILHGFVILCRNGDVLTITTDQLLQAQNNPHSLLPHDFPNPCAILMSGFSSIANFDRISNQAVLLCCGTEPADNATRRVHTEIHLIKLPLDTPDSHQVFLRTAFPSTPTCVFFAPPKSAHTSTTPALTPAHLSTALATALWGHQFNPLNDSVVFVGLQCGLVMAASQQSSTSTSASGHKRLCDLSSPVQHIFPICFNFASSPQADAIVALAANGFLAVITSRTPAASDKFIVFPFQLPFVRCVTHCIQISGSIFLLRALTVTQNVELKQINFKRFDEAGRIDMDCHGVSPTIVSPSVISTCHFISSNLQQLSSSVQFVSKALESSSSRQLARINTVHVSALLSTNSAAEATDSILTSKLIPPVQGIQYSLNCLASLTNIHSKLKSDIESRSNALAKLHLAFMLVNDVHKITCETFCLPCALPNPVSFETFISLRIALSGAQALARAVQGGVEISVLVRVFPPELPSVTVKPSTHSQTTCVALKDDNVNANGCTIHVPVSSTSLLPHFFV
jgi:hypothetical protein